MKPLMEARLKSWVQRHGGTYGSGSGLILGRRNGYLFCFGTDAAGEYGSLSFSVKDTALRPMSQKDVGDLVRRIPGLFSGNVDGSRVDFNVAHGNLGQLSVLLDEITLFFHEHRFQDCCQECGGRGAGVVFDGGDAWAYLCPGCAERRVVSGDLAVSIWRLETFQ